MNKRTPVSVYRLFSSLSNKQILFDSFKETPCIMEGGEGTPHILCLWGGKNWDGDTAQP